MVLDPMTVDNLWYMSQPLQEKTLVMLTCDAGLLLHLQSRQTVTTHSQHWLHDDVLYINLRVEQQYLLHRPWHMHTQPACQHCQIGFACTTACAAKIAAQYVMTQGIQGCRERQPSCTLHAPPGACRTRLGSRAWHS